MEAVVEARREYLYMLQECVIPEIMNTFIAMWRDTDHAFRGGQGRLNHFKELAHTVHTWSENNIDVHVDSIRTECPWIDKLIEAVIVSLVQIMSSVKVNKESRKISLTIPTPSEFIRKCYKVSEEEIVKKPDFMLNEETYEVNLFEKISKAMNIVIRSYVPLQHIMTPTSTTEVDLDPVEEEPPELIGEEDDDVLMRDAAEEKTIVTDNGDA